jgi:hypothetical protein
LHDGAVCTDLSDQPGMRINEAKSESHKRIELA